MRRGWPSGAHLAGQAAGQVHAGNTIACDTCPAGPERMVILMPKASRWPSPAGLKEIADTLEGLIGRIHACWVLPNEPKKAWWDKRKPRRVRVQTFADRMRRHRAEHGSIEHDALLKILETEGTELRQLITGRVVLGWPFQVCSAIKFLGRFLTELADCLGTKGKHSVPIRLVRTAEGVLGELRTAKPLEHASRNPPAQKTGQGEAGGGEDTPKTPLEPVGGPGGTTPSVKEEAQDQRLLEQVPERIPMQTMTVWKNATEAARYVGVTPPTIRNWIADKQLTLFRKTGNRLLLSEKELNDCKERTEARKAKATHKKNQQSD